MDHNNSLFEAVLIRFVESIAPDVVDAISEFENKSQHLTKKEDRHQIIASIFSYFPRKIHSYVKTMEMFASIAEVHTQSIIIKLIKLIKDIILSDQNNILNAIVNLVPIYDNNVVEHRYIMFYFSIIITSDIITLLIKKYGPCGTENELCDVVYSMSFCAVRVQKVANIIFDQWSVIVSLVNNNSPDLVLSLFDGLIQSENYKSAYYFTRFVKFDTTFPCYIFYDLAFTGFLTPEISEAALFLFLSSPLDNKLFADFFDRFKNSNDMTLLTICCIIMQRISLSQKEQRQFIKKKIIFQAANEATLWQCLLAFWFCITISSNASSWVFIHQIFSKDNPKMEILKYKSDTANPKFLITSFSKTFFEKSNFNACTNLFSFIMAHLAALDFKLFKEILVPKFMKLDINDSRFICFLRMLKYINSPVFKTLVSNEEINEFNKKVSNKVHDTFFSFNPTNGPSAIWLFGSKARLSSLIAESQQKVTMFLDLCKFHTLNSNEFKPRFSYPNNEISLLTSLMRSIFYLFNENDFNNEKFMNLIIDYTYNSNSNVSKHAYQIIQTVYYNNNCKFLDVLLDKFPTFTDDHQFFSCLRLITFLHEQNFNFSPEQKQKLEYFAFLSLAWHMPDIRNYGILILDKLKLQIGSLFSPNKILLQKRLKNKLQRYSTHTLPPDAEISLSAIYNSYYYDLWIIVLSEFLMYLIENHHTSILTTLRSLLEKNYDANIGYLIIYANSLHNEGIAPNDNEQILFETFQKIIQKGKYEMVFSALPLIHESLSVPCFQIFGLIDESIDMKLAAKVMVECLLLTDVNGVMQSSLLPQVINFISLLNNYIIHLDINSPRVIHWSDSHEEKVIAYKDFIINYLNIICFAFDSTVPIGDNIWSLSSRDVMFRFLVNWAITSSSKLSSVREYSITALVTIVKDGPVFSDALLFDSSVVCLFGRIEKQRHNFLSFLLYYHIDLLLETFIEACLTQPRIIADLFIESLIKSAVKQKVVYSCSGKILLLCFVLKYIDHPQANALLHCFLKVVLSRPRRQISYEQISKELLASPYTKVIPEYFAYCTEDVFHTGFDLLQKKTNISSFDICEALKPWVQNLRLLPKQNTCTPSVTKNFNFFTPYNFLVKLIQTTEKAEDDNFVSVMSLWTELMKSPDHRDIVMLFLTSWLKNDIKRRIFSFLSSDEAIVRQLCMNLSFAYHYYITVSQKRRFSSEFWVIPILQDSFKNNWDFLEHNIIKIIHFIFLYNESETHEFYTFICNQYAVDDIDPFSAVKPLLEQLNSTLKLPLSSSSSSSYLLSNPETIVINASAPVISNQRAPTNAPDDECSFAWGNEALKWIIGGKSLKLAYKSFKIYNQILKPMDQDIMKLVAKSVLYHIKKCSENDYPLLNEFICESFYFMASAFNENEQFALQYLHCFIDSPFYQSVSTQLLVKVLTSKKTHQKAWPSIIGMVNPLLNKIEDNEQIQKLFELFIKTSHNEELMMLVAPIKKLNPSLFPSSSDCDKLYSTVSESIMCKVLPRYARLMKTASRNLMNSIFEVSSMIMEKVADENINPSLSQIYSFALHTLFECPNAITFIKTLNKRSCNVSTIPTSDHLEYDRNVDDVVRALERLPQFVETSFNSVTDCKSYLCVSSFMNENVNPTILPFGAQQEIVDAMIRVANSSNFKKTYSFKKLNTQSSSTATSYKSGLFGFGLPSLNFSQDIVLKPLIHPIAVFPRDKVSGEIPDADLVISCSDFLRLAEL